LKENFPVEIDEKDEKYTLSYGALKQMTVWIENKKLYVDTISNKEASSDDVIDTNKRFRKFLRDATGYTTKQRIKKAKKEAGD